jgi:hypothetical protein
MLTTSLSPLLDPILDGKTYFYIETCMILGEPGAVHEPFL